jgi:hypothetical protein
MALESMAPTKKGEVSCGFVFLWYPPKRGGGVSCGDMLVCSIKGLDALGIQVPCHNADNEIRWRHPTRSHMYKSASTHKVRLFITDSRFMHLYLPPFPPRT